MNRIKIQVNQETITAKSDRPLIAGSVGIVSVIAEFDESWDDYIKTLVFTAGDYRREVSKALLYSGGELQLPWEVLEYPGELMISASGVAQGIVHPTAAMRRGLRIWSAGELPVRSSREPNPELWQQVLENVSQIRENSDRVGDAVVASEQSRTAAEAAARGSEQAAAQAAASAQDAQEAGAEARRAQAAAEAAREAVEAARDMTVYAAVVTLAASGWSDDAPYTQTASAAGMTESWIPGIPVLVPGQTLQEDMAAREALACISKIISEAGKLTFVCYEEKPEVDITVRVPGLLCAE